jgi:CRP-like cAMP-binding protein
MLGPRFAEIIGLNEDQSIPTSTLADLLRGIPFFAALPDDSIACLSALKTGRIEDYLPGETILRSGLAEEFVVVISGAVKSGRTIVRGGSVFDPVPVVLNGRIVKRVIALESTRIFRLDRDAFERAMQACPRVAWALIHQIAVRVGSRRPRQAIALPPSL